MVLQTLLLHNFRNHLESSFEFGEGANILLGDNGEGKTNVIEAISYLCLTKSFFAGSDLHVLNFGQSVFEVEGMIRSAHGLESRIRVAYDREQAVKVYTVNKHRIEPFSAVIGRFPLVICSPEHGPITLGGPGERRKFIDFVISQSSDAYFADLMEYRRVLKQRNTILFNAKISKSDPAPLLEPWDEQLARTGSTVISRRRRFIGEFQPFIASAYRHLVGRGEEPSIMYEPFTPVRGDIADAGIRELLLREIAARSAEERRIGTTLVGPHRDELLFRINDLDLRKYASQGQHKTFLVALKLGEFFYLKERCSETPILLLDDIFSELDEERSERLLGFVAGISQTFITSTNVHLFGSAIRADGRNRTFLIQGGSVVFREIQETA